jgi:hypothetical protein
MRIREGYVARAGSCSVMRGVFFCILILAGTIGVRAEIAPEHYARMQDDAPEYITIEAVAVRRGLALFDRTRPVTVTARVTSVSRSASGLTAGETITISYEHFNPRRGWVGPRPIPILQPGSRYPAYLAWDDEDVAYRPAAMGASFEPAVAD